MADSCLADDRGEKLKLYAEAPIEEYWIVNLIDRCVEVCRAPDGSSYTHRQVFRGDNELRPTKVPEIALKPVRIFTK